MDEELIVTRIFEQKFVMCVNTDYITSLEKEGCLKSLKTHDHTLISAQKMPNRIIERCQTKYEKLCKINHMNILASNLYAVLRVN